MILVVLRVKCKFRTDSFRPKSPMFALLSSNHGSDSREMTGITKIPCRRFFWYFFCAPGLKEVFFLFEGDDDTTVLGAYFGTDSVIVAFFNYAIVTRSKLSHFDVILQIACLHFTRFHTRLYGALLIIWHKKIGFMFFAQSSLQSFRLEPIEILYHIFKKCIPMKSSYFFE